MLKKQLLAWTILNDLDWHHTSKNTYFIYHPTEDKRVCSVVCDHNDLVSVRICPHFKHSKYHVDLAIYGGNLC